MNALHVLFKVDGADYALSAADVIQMESYQGATKVPGTRPYVAGLVQIRGRVTPVIDLRTRFGLPPAAQTIDSRVVVVKRGERLVGLLVDSAREVLSLPPESFRAPPEVIAERSKGFVRSVGAAGSRLIMLIDLEKVVQEGDADA